MLQKAKEDNRDPYLSLLQYRNAPTKSCGRTPAKLMFSRRLRSMLPSTNEQLAPQSIDPNKIRKTMQDFQIKTKVNMTEPRENIHLSKSVNQYTCRETSFGNLRKSFHSTTSTRIMCRRHKVQIIPKQEILE